MVRTLLSGKFLCLVAIVLLAGCTVPAEMRGQREVSVAQSEPALETQQDTSTLVAETDPGPPDDDRDGVANLHDHCKDTPRGATVDAMGCPHDSDGDGVLDGIDRCPNTMQVVGLVIDSLGCPSDADHDGVPDNRDLCPKTPADVQVTAQGCPTDDDEDGVPDYLDKCPETPQGMKVTSTGCEPDGDGDGVPDSDDLCPGTLKGGKVDKSGCLVMTQLHRKLILHVNYVPGTTDPDAISLRVLDDLAIRLKNNPEMIAVVEGFTDNIGLDSANLVVSQKRAEKIAEYLIKQGISDHRVESYGRGESNFIADNSTSAGRQKNRRIEITYHTRQGQ